MAIIVPSKKLYDVQSPQILKNAVKGITIDLINDKSLYSQDNNNAYDYEISLEKTTDTIFDISQSFFDGFRNVASNNEWERIRYVSAAAKCGKNSSGQAKINRFGNGYYIVSINPVLKLDVSVYRGTTTAFFKKTKEPITNGLSEATPSVNENDPVIKFMGYETSADFELISNLNDYNFSTQFSKDLEIKYSDLTLSTNILSNINLVRKKYISQSISSDFSIYNSKNEHTMNINRKHKSLYGSTASLNYSLDKDFITFNYSYAKEILIDYFADVFKEPETDQALKTVDCERYDFEVTKATIVLNEIITKIETSNITETIKNDTTNGVSLSVGQNQFIKEGTTYNDVDGIEQLWGNVIKKYKNGKSYVRFVCSMGDYYDEQGEKVISTDSSGKMGFEVYDRVVVMRRNGNNQDEPIKYDSFGSTKVFSVVSVKPYFDGALWQEVVAIETDEAINTVIKAGTYVFNQFITYNGNDKGIKQTNINFTSYYGLEYNTIEISNDRLLYSFYDNDGTQVRNIVAYSLKTWAYNCQTITIANDTPVLSDFYYFFVQNATKI